VAAAALALLLPGTACGLVYSPSNRFNAVYDTWFHHDHRAADNSSVWLLNFLTTHDPVPALKGENLGWNAYASATSSDGVRFADAGLALRRGCAGDRPEDSPSCMSQSGPGIGRWPETIEGIGSGSVWRLLKNATAPGNASAAVAVDDAEEVADAQGEEWVMNYSQEHGNLSTADGRKIPAGQSIFFARSSDLVNWVPVNDLDAVVEFIFHADSRWYHTSGAMRWDTISAMPRPGGGYYGYLTAAPLTPSNKSSPSYCSTPGTTGCGVGLAQSDDGLHWTALESPGPNFVGEMGGVCRLGGKVWMTFDAGHLVSAPSLTGPFAAERTNFDFRTYPGAGGGRAPYSGAGYPRLWGETNTGDPELCVITHGFGDYVGLVKRGLLGGDGVLRAGWWGHNDNLKGRALTVLGQLPVNASVPGGSSTSCVHQCMTAGIWLEGSLPLTKSTNASGLWMQTGSGGWASTINSEGVFSVGGHTIDRGRFLAGKSSARWHALVRNSWSGHTIDKRGNVRVTQGAMMIEWYVEGVLADSVYTSSAATGGFAPLGGATVTAVHQLSLPESTPYLKSDDLDSSTASSNDGDTDSTPPPFDDARRLGGYAARGYPS
jgi:hypothetical protein